MLRWLHEWPMNLSESKCRRPNFGTHGLTWRTKTAQSKARLRHPCGWSVCWILERWMSPSHDNQCQPRPDCQMAHGLTSCAGNLHSNTQDAQRCWLPCSTALPWFVEIAIALESTDWCENARCETQSPAQFVQPRNQLWRSITSRLAHSPIRLFHQTCQSLWDARLHASCRAALSTGIQRFVVFPRPPKFRQGLAKIRECLQALAAKAWPLCRREYQCVRRVVHRCPILPTLQAHPDTTCLKQ